MKTLAELTAIRDKMKSQVEMRSGSENEKTRVVVGMATCGIAAGARPVLAELISEIDKRQLHDVLITQTGCIGVCRLEPIVEIYKPGEEKVTYVKVTPDMVGKIVAEHIVNNNVVKEYTIGAADNN
ncbi:MAG: (2Fe-2S) ferredoxin domain-containing protein [Clostridia bacterium]